MPSLIEKPTQIVAAGTKPKLIEEFVGHVNSKTAGVSVARMRSPAGWSEPGQTPEFDEYSIVLSGTLRVAHKSGSLEVRAGQAVIAQGGEWVQYSTPEDAEYISVCVCRRFLRPTCTAIERFFIECLSQTRKILFAKVEFSNILVSSGVHN